MTKKEYLEIENHMKIHMQDSAHDMNHIYRVLNMALDIASYEETVDIDVLAAACLLHDIGRQKQFENPAICHAQAGSEMAFTYLSKIGWPREKALHVKECIAAHRYRNNTPSASIEAKILFDSDKLDVTGAIGVARTLVYKGRTDEPLYTLDESGDVILEGDGSSITSFFQEYNYKLKKVYDSFYTKRAAELSTKRRIAMESFYNSLLDEVSNSQKIAKHRLSALWTETEQVL